MNLSDIRHLFDYTEWANELALKAAAELSDDDLRRDFKISHSSILGTLLAHGRGGVDLAGTLARTDRPQPRRPGRFGRPTRVLILKF